MGINILVHRQNNIEEALKWIDQGFGVEVDVWPQDDRLVLTHDAPRTNSFYEALPTLLQVNADRQKIAINIKSEGVADSLKKALEGYSNYFIFDGSFPEQKKIMDHGLKYFDRFSDLENSNRYQVLPLGSWVDSWEGIFIPTGRVQRGHLAYVSNDLRGFTYLTQWELIKDSVIDSNRRFYLCTKKPLEAREFFK